MAKLNGTLYAFNADGDNIASCTSTSVSFNLDLPDTTTKGSGGYAEHLGGLRSGEGSFDALYDTSDTYSAAEIFDQLDARTSIACMLLAEGESGTIAFDFEASFSSLEFNTEMEQPVSLSGSFTINGTFSRRAIT